MKSYRPFLTVLFLGISGCVTANGGDREQLKTELLTFSDWQISQTQFCPEEPVVIFAKVTNILGKKRDLRLIPGDNNRALVRIVDSNGAVVWDTDELDRIEERRHIEQHGMERIFAGPGIYNLSLEPGASAFWISRWEQRDLAGNYVKQGEFQIEVNYRYLHLNGEEDRVSIRVGPATILISEQGCD